VAEWVRGILVEVRLAADESPTADAWNDSAALARPVARFEAAADEALLDPALARAKLAVLGKAGELGAGSGSAR